MKDGELSITRFCVNFRSDSCQMGPGTWFHSSFLNLKIKWIGKGINEKGYDSKSGELIVSVDPRYFRPTEVETLLGDPTKAKKKLGWKSLISFEDMVKEMMESDIGIARRDSLVIRHGYYAPNNFE